MSEQQGGQPYNPTADNDSANVQDSSNDDAAGADVNPNQAAETPQAPVPAEPAPVQVQPADQSNVKTDKVFDKDYEVTPDRGYRVAKPAPADSEVEGDRPDDTE